MITFENESKNLRGLIKKKLKYLIILSLFILTKVSFGQFYNGHQMDFGKNRVQFESFDWFFLRFQNFDTYFYTGGKQLAMQTAEIAYKEMEEISSTLDYKLDKRLIFVIYHNLSDFRQSNIGLKTMGNQHNIGGTTRIVDNIVFMYIEGDREALKNQIRASIIEITLNEMIFGSSWQNKTTNNALISLPKWYFDGLVSYLTYDWNEDIENHVKNGILNKNYEKINRLQGDDATYAGHSIWYYVANTYGKKVIPTIIYLTKVSKNVESGFMNVLGTNLKTLSYNWLDYYNQLFYQHYQAGDNPKGKNLLKKSRKRHTYQSAKISPNGKYLAYTSNTLGKFKIFLVDTETGKTKKINKQGHKLEQIIDYSYPSIKWHPTGKLVCWITEKKGKIYYMTYNIETKKRNKIELKGFNKVLDFDFSDNGFDIVFNGFRNGQSDLFLYNLASNTYKNLTADKADDYHPVFIRNSKQILFSSKRLVDSITDTDEYQVPTQENRDIFLYDINAKTHPLTQLTRTPDTDEKEAYLSDDNFYIYLSNENGIYNRFSATYDSTISHVDTITHYRYYMRSFPLTNYKMNIQEQDVSDKTSAFAEIYYDKNKFQIHKGNLSNTISSIKQSKTNYRKSYQNKAKEISDKDKEEPSSTPLKPNTDSLININDYVFEETSLETDKAESDFKDNGSLKHKIVNKYLTTFYTTQIINQIDFGFLNASYQRFTGSGFYFNPGFNLLLTLEAMDLFEDYRITGGFRFSGNFDSNEYLISFEDLKKRLNKQYIFHRQAITDLQENSMFKSYLHQGVYRLRYPFNQVSAVQGSLSLRQDKRAYLSTDHQNLLKQNSYEYWGGVKLEYIFDNSRKLMTNIHEGTKLKVFGEYYKEISRKKNNNLYVVGLDFRHYIPIHRNLIFATRFAASTSFGNAKLIYYLGGVDNWINLSTKRPMFDNTTRINPNENYAYQAVATNMRGFTQNVRNGNSFAVANMEIRWPIISYLLNRPLNSDFLNTFQIVGFFDLGSAWTGLNPFSEDNAYQNDIYQNGSVTIIIDNESYPFVAGYGVGIRTKLLGYFLRLDYAKGIENNVQLPGMFYLSLNLDF